MARRSLTATSSAFGSRARGDMLPATADSLGRERPRPARFGGQVPAPVPSSSALRISPAAEHRVAQRLAIPPAGVHGHEYAGADREQAAAVTPAVAASA